MAVSFKSFILRNIGLIIQLIGPKVNGFVILVSVSYLCDMEEKIEWLIRLISTNGYGEYNEPMPCSRSEMIKLLKSIIQHFKEYWHEEEN